MRRRKRFGRVIRFLFTASAPQAAVTSTAVQSRQAAAVFAIFLFLFIFDSPLYTDVIKVLGEEDLLMDLSGLDCAENLREVVKTANVVNGRLVAVPQEVVAYGLRWASFGLESPALLPRSPHSRRPSLHRYIPCLSSPAETQNRGAYNHCTCSHRCLRPQSPPPYCRRYTDPHKPEQTQRFPATICWRPPASLFRSP